LLDISNNNEYVWTTIFNPSPPSSPPSPLPPSSLNNSSNIAGAVIGSLLVSGIFLSVGSFLIYYKWNKNKRKQKTIHGSEYCNNYNQEEREISIEKDIHNDEQEINQISRNKNATNHEPIIISDNDNNEQEILKTPKNENNENKTNHEPTITASAVVSDHNDKRLSLQAFKDEMLQAVKQEINQNLRNEILQIVRQENYNNTKNSTSQD
jgi:hypothetical protein